MSEHRDESVTHESPTGAQDYFEIRRRALRGLLGLSAETVAPAELEIEQRYQGARAQAEERLEEATAEIKSHLQEKVEATARAHADRVKQIQSEYESARDRLARQTKESLERVAAESSETEREARRRSDDNLLIAETVPQATIEGLHEELQSVQRQVTAGHQQLESLQARALRLLRDYRHAPERDSVAAAEEVSASGDAGAAYEDLAKAARQHLKTLQRLSTPRLFVGARPYGLLVLLCAVPVGAMGALSLLETSYAPPFLISGPVAFVVTLVVGLLVGGALWRKAHVRIEQEYEPLRRALAAAGQALDRRLKRVEEQARRGEARAIERRDRETQTVRNQFDSAIAEAEQRRAMSLKRVEEARLKREAEIEHRRESASREADDEKDRRRLKLQERHDRDLAAARQDYERQLDESRRRHRRCRSRRDNGMAC